MRILRDTAATLSVTFHVDGVGTDPSPDSATVTITRDDGTAVVTAQSATGGAGGLFTYNLSSTHTAVLDILTAEWTATLSGQVQTLTTTVEVVGGFLCSLAQIDSLLTKGNDTPSVTYSLAARQEARDVASDAIEAECGVAFAPRYARRSFNGPLGTDLVLPTPLPISVTSAVVDDETLDVADLWIDKGGVVYREDRWGGQRNGVTLKWEHGFKHTPADVSRATALLASSLIKDGPYDDRGYRVTDDGGGVSLLTAGVSGAVFSIPEVESVVRRYRIPVYV